MVRPKAFGSKKPKRAGSIDFKKIRRKIGRKLPPPKNATDTHIKSKAIVLPEQSLVTERTGLAVSSRGLTLKELLHQTSHHNAKTRKSALVGIRDLLLQNPSELKLHTLVIIEKLRERICDNDKTVRHTLYNLLEAVILPGIKEEITSPLTSLLMAYLFNAMTHLVLDIRLMAFKFFLLIVLNHPSSFLPYADKVLDCYGDILRCMLLYFEDKSKTRDILDGLFHCLSSLVLKSKEKVELRHGVNVKLPLHAFDIELLQGHLGPSTIMKKIEDLIPLLINCFQEFISAVYTQAAIDTVSFNCMLCILRIISLAVNFFAAEQDLAHRSSWISVPPFCMNSSAVNSSVSSHMGSLWKIFPVRSMNQSVKKEDKKYFIINVNIAEIFFHLPHRSDSKILLEKFLEFVEDALGRQEKQLVPVIQLIPGLVSRISGCWKARILTAFSVAFHNCTVDSKAMMASLSALIEMLLPRDRQIIDFNSEELLCYQIAWLHKLPELLLELGDKDPSISKVILELQLRIGQRSVHQSPLGLEFDSLQFTLKEFYSRYDDKGSRHHGPFVHLPADCQEIAICGLYYFSNLDPSLLEALAFCCLGNDLGAALVMRILEVLSSVYRSGHVKLAYYVGFLVTLLARLGTFPEDDCSGHESTVKASSSGTFKEITEAVASHLLEIGDSSLVLKLVLKVILEEMSLKPPLNNTQAMLSTIVLLGCGQSTSSEATSILGQITSAYLIDASYHVTKHMDVAGEDEGSHMHQFYVGPCVTLFMRSDKLLSEVLKTLHPCATSDFKQVRAVASTFIFMLKDMKLRDHLSFSEESIKNVLQRIHTVLSEGSEMSFGERCKLQRVFEQLKRGACNLHGWKS